MKPAIQTYSDPQIEDDVCRWIVQDFQRIEAVFHDLKPAYLTQSHTRAVHAIVSRLHAAGQPIDPTIVILEAGNVVGEDMKPLVYEFQSYGIPLTNTSTFLHFVSKLRDHWKRRTLRNATSDINVGDPHEAAVMLREALDAVADPPPVPPSMSEMLNAWAENLSELAAGRKKPGTLTNIPSLDAITCGGIRPGELWVVAGGTSSGKTALQVQTSGNLLDDGNAVFIASLEMPTCQMIDRIVCNRGSVFLSKLRDPAAHPLSKLDLQCISKVVLRMKDNWRFEIHDGTTELVGILASAKAMKQRIGLDVLVIDYLQIATIVGDYGTREREVAHISRTLKRFAIAEHIGVIALSQLNDDGQIRESRAISHDADLVGKIIEDGLFIQKNRNGQSGVVLPLILDGRTQTFIEHTNQCETEPPPPQPSPSRHPSIRARRRRT